MEKERERGRGLFCYTVQGSSPSWWESEGSRSWRCLVTLCQEPGSGDGGGGGVNASAHLAFWVYTQTRILMHDIVQPTIKVDLPSLINI